MIYIHSQGMIHGDLKGVRFSRRSHSSSLTEPAKANILIDETGRARLADFGLLTIISDPKYHLSSSSHTQGGTVRWMSPERIAPQRFGFKNSRPTVASDCYALGMVVYETISGNLPFHKDTDLAVFMKVVEGERPPRGARFMESLWRMLEMCWEPQPNDRPSIEYILQCLEVVSSLPEPPSPGAGEEMDEDSDDWDSTTGSFGILDRRGGMATTEWSTPMSAGMDYLTDRPPNPPSTLSGLSIVEAGIDGIGRAVTDLNLSISPINSSDGGTYHVSAICSHRSLYPCKTTLYRTRSVQFLK